MKKIFYTLCFVLLWVAFSHAAMGPLTQSTTNPLYFEDTDGNIVVLTGFHTWASLSDIDDQPFTWSTFLSELLAYDMNVTKLWAVDVPNSCTEVSSPHRWSRAASCTPGVDCATDGLAKFDFDTFDATYFSRLATRVSSLQDSGIYAIVMLFDGWGIQYCSASGSDGFPYRSTNNINSVSIATDLEPYTTTDTTILNYQKAYIEKVYDTIKPYNNVLFEICNECGSGSTAWQEELISYLSAYMVSEGKVFPIGMTYQFGLSEGEDATLDASDADWVSYGEGQTTNWTNPAIETGDKVSVLDTDHVGAWTLTEEWQWRAFTRGHNPIDMQSGMQATDATFPANKRALKGIRKYIDKMDMSAVIPKTSTSGSNSCSSGYMLYDDGEEYLCFRNSTSGNLVITPSGSGTIYTVEIYNPATQAISSPADITGGAASTISLGTGEEGMVVYLKKKDEEQPPGNEVTAADCNLNSVRTAIGSASRGWTVKIPAGECDWNDTLALSFPIKLQGEGAGTTNITYTGSNQSAGWTGYWLIHFNATAPSSDAPYTLDISGMTLDGANKIGLIAVRNKVKPWDMEHPIKYRIHDMIINNPVKGGIVPGGDFMDTILIEGVVQGVIDSNTISGVPHFDIYGCDTTNGGIACWNVADWVPGNINLTTYVENNTITVNQSLAAQNSSGTWYYGGNLTTLGRGGAFVFRYNDITYASEAAYGTNGMFDNHGVQIYSGGSQDAAGYGHEVYGNKITVSGSITVNLMDASGGRNLDFYNNLISSGTVGNTLWESYEQSYLTGGTNACAGQPAVYACDKNSEWNNMSKTYIFKNLKNNTSELSVSVASDYGDFVPTLGTNYFTTGTGITCGSTVPTGSSTTGYAKWVTSQSCSDLSNIAIGKDPDTSKLITGKLYRYSGIAWVEYYAPAAYPHPYRGTDPGDTSPPTILTTSPPSTTACDDESPVDKTLTVTTNETANCAYCLSGDGCTSSSTYDSVLVAGGLMSTTGSLSHSQTLSALPCDASYTYYVSCRDTSSNQNKMIAPTEVAFTIAVASGDSTAPVLSNPLPAGTQYTCGVDVTLQVTATDETTPITCKYNTSDVAYASMSGTFDAPGGGSTPAISDSYPESNYETTGVALFYTGWLDEGGQSFNGDGNVLSSVRLYLAKRGTVTGNAVVKIYAHTGTYGSTGVPTGSALATSENIDVSTLSTGMALTTFTFTGANRITIEAGTKYFWTLYYTNGTDVSNCVVLGGDDVAPSHAGNSTYDESGWVAQSSKDRIFYVDTMSGTGGGVGTHTKVLSSPTCGASYIYYIRCTDGTNPNLSSQTATFTVLPRVTGRIEFEEGTNTSPMLELTDPAASGGYYVATTTANSGTSSHTVSAPSEGDYRIIINSYATDTGSDTIYFAKGTTTEYLCSLNPTGASNKYGTWVEQIMKCWNGTSWEEYQVALATEGNVFTFRGAKPNARLDYFYIEKRIDPPQPPTGKTYRIIGSGNTVIIGTGNTVIIE